MLNNLVNADDFAVVARKVAGGQLCEVFTRLRMAGRERIQSQWETQWDGGIPPTQWFDLAAVRRRENRLVSGDPEVGYIEYLSGKYLSGRHGLIGLSLGCGSGWRELEWARRAEFRSLQAFDISESGIRQARADAAASGLDGVVDFGVGDVNQLEFEASSFDVILLRTPSITSRRWSRSSPASATGWARRVNPIVNEFVGPTRFQFTSRQLELANSLLTLLPDRYRREWGSGVAKKRVSQPSRLRMRIKDPSEAVESEQIMPLLREHFEIIEEKPTGGTIVYLVLDGIAHNFIDSDEFGEHLLELCFQWEELLIDRGDIDSDHILTVCRPRA